MLTIPGLVVSAPPKVRVLPLMLPPLAIEAPAYDPIMLTPVLTAVVVQALPFQNKFMLLPLLSVMPATVIGTDPMLAMKICRPAVESVGLGIVTEMLLV